MRVAINAQLLNGAASYRNAGVSSYSQQLLTHLGRLVSEGENCQLIAFVNDSSFHAPGVDLCRSNAVLARPLARIAWEQTILPATLGQMDVDLVHGLVNVLPLATSLPGVVTVHDLSFLRLPSAFPAAKRFYLTQLCRASVAKARGVIAVSQQTADDLIRFFDAPPSRVHVVHNGVGPEFCVGDPEADVEFRRNKGLPDRFFFFVGTLEPRKNLACLIRAFAAWRKQANSSDSAVSLVIGGAKGWFYAEIFHLVVELGLAHVVHFPGYIAHDELPAWFRAAEAFVYPSLFEGFGLPVLEAMACGAPVLCSRAPSLIEIVADGALTVPADDERALTDALGLLASQPAVRAELRRRGLTRAGLFSWQQTATATMQVYQTAVAA